MLEGIIEEERQSPVRARCKNDIKEVRNLRQLERLELDLESPRWRLACLNWCNSSGMPEKLKLVYFIPYRRGEDFLGEGPG
jgi:hypothetical protein